MITPLTRKDADPSLLVNWALRFLEENKHRVGDSFLNANRVLVIPVDGKDLIVEENGDIVKMASKYSDWPQRREQFVAWVEEHTRKR
jgi:hypothetical protein